MLANSCLGQSTLTSRLGVAVRDGAGLTYGIYSRFFGTLHVAGPWATALGVSADNLDRAVELSLEVIAKYVEEGPTEEELADERLGPRRRLSRWSCHQLWHRSRAGDGPHGR